MMDLGQRAVQVRVVVVVVGVVRRVQTVEVVRTAGSILVGSK